MSTRSSALDAHRLLGWALEAGCQELLKERLMQLYFVEGADVGDHDVLAKAAADCGMNGDDVRRRLSSEEDVENTRAEIERIHNLGINGVPFFIIASKYGLSGAQPAETLVEAMRRAVADEDLKD